MNVRAMIAEKHSGTVNAMIEPLEEVINSCKRDVDKVPPHAILRPNGEYRCCDARRCAYKSLMGDVQICNYARGNYE